MPASRTDVTDTSVLRCASQRLAGATTQPAADDMSDYTIGLDSMCQLLPFINPE